MTKKIAAAAMEASAVDLATPSCTFLPPLFSCPTGRGPVLLAVKIDDEPGQGQTPRDPALIRSRFMKGLGTGRGGALEA
jgi:hypothetical protein